MYRPGGSGGRVVVLRYRPGGGRGVGKGYRRYLPSYTVATNYRVGSPGGQNPFFKCC